MNVHPLALAPIGDEAAGVFLVGVGLFSIVVALCLLLSVRMPHEVV
jgi:hypothetical protein